jgi:hypothetical protein
VLAPPGPLPTTMASNEEGSTGSMVIETVWKHRC